MCVFSILFFPHIHIPIFLSVYQFSRYLNNEHKDHENSYPDLDFERSLYVNEIEFEEDIKESNLPLKMLRLLTMEDKQILPHQEVT